MVVKRLDSKHKRLDSKEIRNVRKRERLDCEEGRKDKDQEHERTVRRSGNYNQPKTAKIKKILAVKCTPVRVGPRAAHISASSEKINRIDDHACREGSGRTD